MTYPAGKSASRDGRTTGAPDDGAFGTPRGDTESGALYFRLIPNASDEVLPSSMVDRADLTTLSAAVLVEAFDEVGVGSTWRLAQRLRRSAAGRLVGDPPALAPEPRRPKRNQAFENLVVGALAERIFRERHLARLEPMGFTILDLHRRGENRDFAVRRDGLELPINVKVASSMYRMAQRHVGLAPDDCIPIGTYKAISACERVPDLVYVDLVDFNLREKVDSFMQSLEGSLAILRELLAWYGGPGLKRAQDEYIDGLFRARGDELVSLVPGASSYRVISAQRALAIMRANPRRVPGLGVPRAGTGSFNAEVNVHISVQHETEAWDAIHEALCRDGIQPLLDRIRRTQPHIEPAPTL